MEPKKTIRVQIPMSVNCYHAEEEDESFVAMNLIEDDSEVPSYMAVCPKCNATVFIAFEKVCP